MSIPPPDSQQQLIEKINRLQQRQSLLLQQTNTELEDLKNELGSTVSQDYIHQITAPLENELLNLKNQNSLLEQEKKYLNGQLNHLHHQFRSYFAKSQAILESLKENIVDPFSEENELIPLLEPLAVIKVQSTLVTQPDSVPSFVSNTTELSATIPSLQVPTPLSPPIPEQLAPAVSANPVGKKRRPLGRLAFTSLGFLVVVAGTYTGMHKFATINSAASTSSNDSTGQVAGVSTDPGISQGSDLRPDTEKYQESFSNIAFEDTKWQTTTNSALNIKLQYPANASNMVYTPGSDNIWFLRKSGYMFKVNTQEIGPQTTLDQYMQDNQADFTGYSMSKSIFKNIPAWQGLPTKATNTAGTQYVLKVGIHLYTIWTHVTTDETEKHWIDHMIASLEFLPS